MTRAFNMAGVERFELLTRVFFGYKLNSLLSATKIKKLQSYDQSLQYGRGGEIRTPNTCIL